MYPTVCGPRGDQGKFKDIDARTDIYSVGCLLRWIEENTGKELPHTYINIKERCLRERKTERYASTKEIVKSVNKADRYRALCVAACVLVFLAGLYVAFKSPLYDVVCTRWAWATGKAPQRFEADGIFYRITDGDERAVAVTFKGETPQRV